MLVHAMTLADEVLHLTDLSEMNDYLELTDEIVLQKLANLDGDTTNLREARQLANDFRNRKLIKCVFERVIQRRDRTVGQLFGKIRVRNQVVLDLAEKAGVDPIHIYLDVPTTPSVPYTSSREALRSITLVYDDAKKMRTKTVPIEDLPLIGSIAGFVDILRVYTGAEDRDRVAKATTTLFDSEGFMTRISV